MNVISHFAGLYTLLLASPLWAADASANPATRPTTPPVFEAASGGGFTFDTGLLRGSLHSAGKSLGLTEVIHVPSGKRLDRSNGLLSHYRVFTKGVRYGGGAWDWPSHATLSRDGAVEVRWPAAESRPFEMRATYRWRGSDTLDVTTIVRADKDLAGFESFLASYFSEGFTNAAAFVAHSPERQNGPEFLPLRSTYGAWQMFPRDPAVISLIQDGRWNLEPNPVDWTIRPTLAYPISLRRSPETGLTAVLMSPPTDSFAIGAPQQAEGHYSLYFSLVGQDLKAGQVVSARTRLVIATAPSDPQILKLYDGYVREMRSRIP